MDLPSGAELVIQLAPFTDSRELYQAMMEEAKGLKIEGKTDLDYNFFKDIFCTALSSKKIEKAVWKCAAKATYNSLRVTEETFEPAEARQDYLPFLFEVAQVNVEPFMKDLYAKYGHILGTIKKDLA